MGALVLGYHHPASPVHTCWVTTALDRTPGMGDSHEQHILEEEVSTEQGKEGHQVGQGAWRTLIVTTLRVRKAMPWTRQDVPRSQRRLCCGETCVWSSRAGLFVAVSADGATSATGGCRVAEHVPQGTVSRPGSFQWPRAVLHADHSAPQTLCGPHSCPRPRCRSIGVDVNRAPPRSAPALLAADGRDGVGDHRAR